MTTRDTEVDSLHRGVAAAPEHEPSPIEMPQLGDRYLIRKESGRGGMGRVFFARDAWCTRGRSRDHDTRRRHEHVLPAGIAVHAREAVGEDAAREIPLELGDDESREAPAVSALGDLGEERVPVGANGLVEDRPLRLAAAIGRGERPAGDAGWRS